MLNQDCTCPPFPQATDDRCEHCSRSRWGTSRDGAALCFDHLVDHWSALAEEDPR